MITRVVKLDRSNPDQAVIREAADIIKRGGLVAFPTETVYGLGINVSAEASIRNAYLIKERDRGKPFTVHISSINDLSKYNVKITDTAKILMDRFWPGPLTLILPLVDGAWTRGKGLIAEPLLGILRGIGSIGFRFPDDLIAKIFIETAGVPIAAPSANISGKKDPVCADDVLEGLDGKIDMILDGGRTKYSIGSTIMSLAGNPSILRQGAIESKEINNILML